MVPIIHMYYRMTQLGRAFVLNAAMSGPSYIFILLVCLRIALCLRARLTSTERSFTPHLHTCKLLPSCYIDVCEAAPLLTTLRAFQLISLLPPKSRCFAYSLFIQLPRLYVCIAGSAGFCVGVQHCSSDCVDAMAVLLAVSAYKGISHREILLSEKIDMPHFRERNVIGIFFLSGMLCTSMLLRVDSTGSLGPTRSILDLSLQLFELSRS